MKTMANTKIMADFIRSTEKLLQRLCAKLIKLGLTFFVSCDLTGQKVIANATVWSKIPLCIRSVPLHPNVFKKKLLISGDNAFPTGRPHMATDVATLRCLWKCSCINTIAASEARLIPQPVSIHQSNIYF